MSRAGAPLAARPTRLTSATAICRARREAGLTQARLARRAGTSQAAISDYESGRRRPEPATIDRIERALQPLPSTVLDQRRQEVVATAAQFGVTNLRVFGSVARNADTPDSDIDLLADFPADMRAVDLVRLCERLETILGVPVDLVDPSSLGPAGDIIEAEALAL